MIVPFINLLWCNVIVAAAAADCLPIAQLALFDVTSGHVKLPYQNATVVADWSDSCLAGLLIHKGGLVSVLDSL